MGRPPPPSFGQCPKENVFFLLMSSLKYDDVFLDQYNADYLHYLFLFPETFVKTKSSKDECSTDIQSYILDKQIIWINGSLSAQLGRLFIDSTFSFLPQSSHLPTTYQMMLSTGIVPRQLSIYSPNANPCCLLLKKSI